jgi:hypothetical protein
MPDFGDNGVRSYDNRPGYGDVPIKKLKPIPVQLPPKQAVVRQPQPGQFVKVFRSLFSGVSK